MELEEGKNDIGTVIARLKGLATEAEIKWMLAKTHGEIAHQYRAQGEQAGLLRAVDMLTGCEEVLR